MISLCKELSKKKSKPIGNQMEFELTITKYDVLIYHNKYTSTGEKLFIEKGGSTTVVS